MIQTSIQKICAAIVVICLGCGGSNGPKLVPVRGMITLDGKPLDRASITFHPEQGRPSVGFSDDEGKYELQYSFDRAGAMPGRHLVTITSEVVAFRSEDVPKDAPTLPGRQELLPKRYRENTELVVDVQAGQKTYDFNLNSEPDPGEKPKSAAR
ncbi:carboxypeptidase regulatory-like domain-containing protein [Planctomicrobium sp. SH661]|uniref:carboxypeptidase regulatory-like domain-containing protein n=1 Tax=Planctomicrobium sp. SH661 TaxID=3448124 RepID=UPI003F5C178E